MRWDFRLKPRHASLLGLMNIDNLAGTEEAAVAEEFGGGLAVAVEPGLYLGLERLPLLGPGVQVQDLGVELAPGFLDLKL
jgi:hypothetical protein